MEMSEWRGPVKATVIELDADFDVVLGMEWFQKWNPIPDWEKLEFAIKTTSGTKHIRRLPAAPEIQNLEPTKEDRAEFNLITEKELKKALKKKVQVMCVLYFARKSQSEENGPELNQIDEMASVEDEEMRKVVGEFRDVFREDLPAGLPPK